MGHLLVLIQFSAIALLVHFGWRGLLMVPWLFLPIILGCVLGGHSIAVMGFPTFRTVPEPSPNATLCRRGAYRWIRHPMYLAVLIGAICLTYVSSAPLISGGVCFILVAVLLAKMRMEEEFWRLRDPERYGPYLAGTKKLIPFIY